MDSVTCRFVTRDSFLENPANTSNGTPVTAPNSHYSQDYDFLSLPEGFLGISQLTLTLGMLSSTTQSFLSLFLNNISLKKINIIYSILLG